MPDITSVPQYTADVPLRPGPGQIAGMETGPAPMAPLLQLAFDRIHYARGAVWGQFVWSDQFGVDAAPAPTNAVFAVRVGTIEALTLRDAATVWRPYNTAAETVLTVAHVEGAPANLTANSFYYCYAWSDSAAPGAVKFQLSTVPPTELGAPSVLRGYKRGESANFRYVGCFPTDSSGAPVPLHACCGRTTYRFSATASPVLRALPAGTAVAWTDVPLAAWVPPHARVAAVKLDYTAGGAGPNYVAELRTKGDSAGSYDFRGVSGDLVRAHIELPTDASQVIQYKLSSAGDASIYVLGFSK